MTETPDSPPGDEARALLERWQRDQDRDALDRLLRLEIRALADRLRHRAGRQLRPSVSASDLVQEAVLRMLRRKEAPQFEAPEQMRAYLWKSAWRLLLNRLERRPVHRLSQIESKEVGSQLAVSAGPLGIEDEERNLALDLAMNLLPPDDQEILRLFYFEHLDIPTAAERLGVQRGAAEMRLTRARRRLASKLLDWADVIGS